MPYPRPPRRIVQTFVATDAAAIRHGWDSVRAGGIAIAVDDEARVGLVQEGGVEQLRQLSSHPQHSDVDRDVPRAIDGRQLQIAQRAGNSRSGVISDQQERRGTFCVEDAERRRIIGAQQAVRFALDRQDAVPCHC